MAEGKERGVVGHFEARDVGSVVEMVGQQCNQKNVVSASVCMDGLFKCSRPSLSLGVSWKYEENAG